MNLGVYGLLLILALQAGGYAYADAKVFSARLRWSVGGVFGWGALRGVFALGAVVSGLGILTAIT